LENNENFAYYIENDGLDSEKVIKHFLIELDRFIKEENLSENEIKLGHALYDIFENYDSIFIGNDNNKFNKNIVLLSLREMTNMNTKEIRIYLKKYKVLYLETLKKIHSK
jgi:hypothetical protein